MVLDGYVRIVLIASIVINLMELHFRDASGHDKSIVNHFACSYNSSL
jgi:hypothetical protein